MVPCLQKAQQVSITMKFCISSFIVSTWFNHVWQNWVMLPYVAIQSHATNATKSYSIALLRQLTRSQISQATTRKPIRSTCGDQDNWHPHFSIEDTAVETKRQLFGKSHSNCLTLSNYHPILKTLIRTKQSQNK